MNTTLQQTFARAKEIKLVIDGMSLPLVLLKPSEQTLIIGKGEAIPNRFSQETGKWSLGYEGCLVQFADCRGLKYIHYLLKKPLQDIKCSHLVSAANGSVGEWGSSTPTSEQPSDEMNHYLSSTKAVAGYFVNVDEKVDRQTVKQIRQSLNDLKAEIAHHQSTGDVLACEETQEKIDKLELYLKQNCFGNRRANFTHAADKNRRSVQTAIKRAIKAISAVHPTLAKHLLNSIKTGYACSYMPETETSWVL
jgi:hypothetical protein